MNLIYKKTQNHILQKALEFSQNPAFLSIFFHIIILTLIIGFASSKNSNNFEFTKLTVISFNNFSEIKQNKKISAVKKEDDKNKNQEFAKAANGQTAKSQELNSQNSAATAMHYNSYVNAIASELEKRKSRFSLAMAPENVKTVVIFTVKIDENGKLIDYKLSKNSGYDFFDKIATKILTYKKDFPAPPIEIKNSNLEFSIPIIFDSLA